MAIKIKWERLDHFHDIAQVFGGWILLHEDTGLTHDNRSISNQHRGSRAPDQKIAAPKCMVFIPDSEHVWRIQDEIETLITR